MVCEQLLKLKQGQTDIKENKQASSNYQME